MPRHTKEPPTRKAMNVILSSQPDPADITADAGPDAQSVLRHYRLHVDSLSIGMWIAELDRPWLDTPFLIRGFRVDCKEELDALREYCASVIVDIEKSDIEVVEAIRRAELERLPPEAAPDHGPLRKPRRSGRDARSGPEDLPDDATADWMIKDKAPRPSRGRTRESARDKGRGPRPDPGPAGGDLGASRQRAAVAHAGSVRSTSKARSSSRSSSKDAGRAADRRKSSNRSPTGSTRPRRDVTISGSTRAQFRRMIQEATASQDEPRGLRGLLLGIARAVGLAPDPAHLARERKRRHLEVRRSLPIATTHEYRDVRPIEDELPRARGAFSKGCETIETLLADIRNQRSADIVQVHTVVDHIVASMLGNPDALMWVARLRDEDMSTYSHGVKVALYMVALGRHLGFPKDDLNKLGMIGMLADVGKTLVPRALLEKPGMLSAAEYHTVKGHVELGLEALRKSITLPEEVELGIVQHHERIDGSGYPSGLEGEAISVYGRIAAIADTFAAMITPRAYANAVAPQEALMSLFEWSGQSFHGPLVEQFIEAIGVFPVGSLVELSTGEVAIIVAHNRTRRLEPKILVLTWPDKQPLAEPIARDLGTRPIGCDGKAIRLARGLSSGAYGLKVRDYYGSESATEI